MDGAKLRNSYGFELSTFYFKEQVKYDIVSMYINTIQMLNMRFIQLFIGQNIRLHKLKMHQVIHIKN